MQHWCSYFGKQFDYFYISTTLRWAIQFPGIYPKEIKTYVPTKTCMQMFIVTAQSFPQLEATQLSSDWWLNKSSAGLPNNNSYSPVKRDGNTDPHNSMDALQGFMLNERSPTPKATNGMTPFLWHSRKNKTVGPAGGGGVTIKGQEGMSGGDETVLYLNLWLQNGTICPNSVLSHI